MTWNCLNEPKVRYELAEGGEPELVTHRLELLVEDYERAKESLRGLGFNDGVMDLEPAKVVEYVMPETDEKKVDALVKLGKMSSAGTLFRMGIIVANAEVVLKAQERMKELKTREEDKKQGKKDDARMKVLSRAGLKYQDWKVAGRPNTGQDKLTAEDWKSIVRAIYPLVAADAEEGLSAYNTGPKCKKWLEELDGGWEIKMDNVVKELNEKLGVVSSERLF